MRERTRAMTACISGRLLVSPTGRPARPVVRAVFPVGRPAFPKRVLLLLAVVLASCDALPRDPNRTLERVRGGELRVGVSEATPWVTFDEESGEPGGLEVEALRGFARSLDAKVRWHRAGSEANLVLLEAGELDVVAAGLPVSSPWAGRVALTRPWSGDRVLATSPGENALLVALERYMARSPPGTGGATEATGISGVTKASGASATTGATAP